MPQRENFNFDVFLSHNSVDKAVVRELKERLVASGLAVWLDEDELRPGVPWPQLLEDGIRNSRTVAVIVGKGGIGPWENEEMQSALILAVKDRRPVIPVLLPEARKKPQLPVFLGSRTWVDLRSGLDENALGKLFWGITGSKPERAPTKKESGAKPVRAPESFPGRRLRCKLNCLEVSSDVIHTRPAKFLVSLCNKFPNTSFCIYKDGHESEPSNPKEIMSLLFGHFKNGQEVTLEVTGEFESMAALFFKIAWENLGGYSDDPVAVTARITTLIDDACTHLYDPDLAEIEERVLKQVISESREEVDEYRTIAVINDRLHYVSLPMIPMVAKHFGCELQILFDLGEKGIFSFAMGKANEYELVKRILDLEIGVGTKITIVTSGTNAEEAGMALRNILQSLWQCDQWLRRRGKNFDALASVPALIAFAREMGKHQADKYGYVQNPFISNLITTGHVFVNAPNSVFSKRAALEQLCIPHARVHQFEVGEILQRVEEAENKQTVILKTGFAVAHGALDHGPRISITFGVYPDGIDWSSGESPVKLVAMVICAQDTYRTWRDYMKRFGILFKSNARLQAELTASATADQFVSTLRNAEISLAKI